MILGVRHGERADASPETFEKSRIELSHDPHLTKLGEFQAQLTAKAILQKLETYENELKSQKLFTKKLEVVILASPFLRTIQTAYHIASSLDCVYEKSVFIFDEIIELLDDDEKYGYKQDPRPILFSNIMKIEDYQRYGLDFMSKSISLKKCELSHSEYKTPIFPESFEKCEARIANFLKNFPKVFYKRFKPTETVLLWVSHQFCLAAACWVLKNSNIKEFPLENVGYCGILDCRVEDVEGECEKIKVLQWGTNEHLNIKKF